MTLFVDIFGLLDVLLRGGALLAQSLTVGGIAFLLCLVRPLSPAMGMRHDEYSHAAVRMLAWSALSLAIVEVLRTGLNATVLVGTIDIGAGTALSASFVFAGGAMVAAALAIAILCAAGHFRHPAALALLAFVILAGSTAMSHAAARIEDRWLPAILFVLHQAAAAVWLGGIPYFLAALARADGAPATLPVAQRFSSMSMVAVAVLVAAGIGLGVLYIGSFAALYGTAYGVMVLGKAVMLGGLLCLGGANFFHIRHMSSAPSLPILRLRRFAEAEIGIGVAVFLAAASLTSTSPAIDLDTDRASWDEIVARNIPRLPSFSSPDQRDLSIPAMQAKLNAEAAARQDVPRAHVPGAGIAPPNTAEDIAWSEFNHHWAGIFVLAVGLLALGERASAASWARHWPLLFVGLAVFLVVRSDPEAWPLGDIGFFESLRDPEVAQHRISALLVGTLGVFEWGVRTGRIRSPRAALVFPLLCAVGGTFLLTHSHSVANVKEGFLIELTHLPIAILAIAAGWTRWLELRLPKADGRRFSWLWPAAISGIGALLLLYREA